MIHYRLFTNNQPINQSIYRSLKKARIIAGDLKGNIEVFAYRSAKNARNNENGLLVNSYDPIPTLITDHDLTYFSALHNDARAIKYPPTHASGRRRLESLYDGYLFGFYGETIVSAQQYMSVSCKWVRYSCPIYINGKKTTVRTLEKLGA